MKQRFNKKLWLLCLGCMFFFMALNMIVPSLPDHLRELNGEKLIGWIISLLVLGSLIASPLSGWAADKMGRKWCFVGGTILCAAATLIYPASQLAAVFLLARGLHGFFMGFAATGFTAQVSDFVPAERLGEAMGYESLFSNFGNALGFALGPIIAVWLGRTNMYFVSVAMAGVALLFFMNLPETKAVDRAKVALKGSIFFIKAWKPAVINLLCGIPIGTFVVKMPDYALQIGFSEKGKGIYLAIYVVISLFSRILSGRLSDKYSRPFSTMLGTGLQVVALLLLLVMQDKASFFASAALFGFGLGFIAPVTFAWAGDISDENSRGRALGTVYLGLEAGLFTGGLLAGNIYSARTADLTGMFALDASALCIALLFSVFAYLKRKRGAEKPLFS